MQQTEASGFVSDFDGLRRRIPHGLTGRSQIRKIPSPSLFGVVKLVQIDNDEILRRMIADEIPVKDGILALIDRVSGHFQPEEGLYLDYKQQVRVDSSTSIAELARDVLAFSNTEGGLLIIGVADSREIFGHDAIDTRKLRDALGPYIGTRVTLDLEEIPVSVHGSTRRIVVVHARRSLNAYPNLLRKDIDFKPGLVRKLKYLKGTLFYRLEN